MKKRPTSSTAQQKIFTNTCIHADVSRTCEKKEHGKCTSTVRNTTSGINPSGL